MDATKREKIWHAVSAVEAARTLAVDPGIGLSSAEAGRRLAEHGPNALPETPPVPFWKQLLEQLKGFVVLILLAATLISLALGDWIEAGVIFAIVVLNAVVGALQNNRAEKALASLKEMAAPEAQVIRDGARTTILARDLVPGDVVLLEAGSIVPADLRLLEAAALRVDESSLTGESVPVEKKSEIVLDPQAQVADRVNSSFMGTIVSYGRAKGIVVGTGLSTELGDIAEMIGGEGKEETPLQRKLEEFGKLLGTVVLVVCAIVFVVSLVREPEIQVLFREGIGPYLHVARTSLLGLFIVAVSLAVAAVPEGLPAFVTMTLAIGMREMLKRHVLIRRLPSVETLGSATVICTDKTGTLTQNQMTVTAVWAAGEPFEVTGQGYAPSGGFTRGGCEVDPKDFPVLERTLWAGLLCNDAELARSPTFRVIGDPTEGALLVAAAKAGMSRESSAELRRAAEVPFDSDRKRMTTIHPAVDGSPISAGGAHYVALTKGAADVVLSLCERIEGRSGPEPLSEKGRVEILAANERMASTGLRVLAAAWRPLRDLPEEVTPQVVERDLIFLGLLGMQDPPRPEVAEAVETARAAGLRSIMITGDHVATAEAIARQIGILRPGGRVIPGLELEEMSDEELAGMIDGVDVFARVSPHHKVRIVDALRAQGHVVAMTGDGVNDAPALRHADIGIAMGIAGTDVAKQSADMVLTDDNYASIVAAVEQGRVIYSNIRKTVYYLLSCNFAEIAIIFLAILVGWKSPLTAIQLLWLNLLTDGAPALALGLEKGEPNVMKSPPRSPRERIINRRMAVGIAFQSGALTAVVLGIYALAHSSGWAAAAGTLAFVTLVLAELPVAYGVRSETTPLYRQGFFSNRSMQWACLISALLLVVVLYVPVFEGPFGVVEPSGKMWAVVLPLAFFPLLVLETRKSFLARRARK